MTKSEELNQMSQQLEGLKKQVEQLFYYAEEEQLRKSPGPSKWSAIQCFEHINLVNHHYLKQLERALAAAQEGEEDFFKHGWFGKRFAKSMAPVEEKSSFKMPTFKKINPIERRKKGIATVEKVVFADLLHDLDRLRNIILQSRTMQFGKMRVVSLAPWLKIYYGDALRLALNHSRRHVQQAERAMQ